MSRDFTRASSQFLSATPAPLTTHPITMACWFYAHDNTNRQTLMNIPDTGALSAIGLEVQGDQAGDPIAAAIAAAGAGSYARSTSGYSLNTWHHACAVFASTTSRTIYLDGGNNATETTSRNPTSLDGVNIGNSGIAASLQYFDGLIAEAAMWNVALTADEVTALAKGVSPLQIRPANLVRYWPLIGNTSPEIDLVGGQALTVTGAVKNDHPPVNYPFGGFFQGITTSNAYTQTLTEILTLSDSILKLPSKLFSETVTLSDTFVRQIGKFFSDTLTYTDTLTASHLFSVPLAETISLADTLAKQTAKTFNDTVTFTDSLIKQAQKALSETATYTDSLIRQISTTLTETITFADVLSAIKSVFLTLTETITFADSLSRQAQKLYSEALSYTDSFTKSLTRTFTETIAYSDVLDTVKAVFLTLTETLTYTDSLARQVSKTVTDTITYADSLTRQTLKSFADTITYSDTLATVKAVFLTLSETISYTDSLIKSTAKSVLDTVSYADDLVRSTLKNFIETVTFTDTLTAILQGAVATAKVYYTGGVSAAKRALRGMGFR